MTTVADWVTLCRESELPPGQRDVFGVNGRWIAVFNIGGTVYAIEDLCTHDGNVLAFDERDQPSRLDGYEIECPRHGARFDIRDGKVTRRPAEVDVPWFKARVAVGNVQIKI